MSYLSTNPLFRDLSDAEEREFREYALNNPPQVLNTNGDWHVLHPVCRRVWITQGYNLCADPCSECSEDVLNEAHWK